MCGVSCIACLTSRIRSATIKRMSGQTPFAEPDLLVAQPSRVRPSETCPYCGRFPLPRRTTASAAPFALLLGLARLVIAIGAAVLLIAILASTLRWGSRGFITGELWAMFATFVLSIGVLVLFELRDLLRRRLVSTVEVTRSLTSDENATPTDNLSGAFWRSIGTLGSVVWYPFQTDDDRLLIAHLTVVEQQELLNRLALVTVCIAVTTITPVVVAFVFMSPLAVCFAATLIASNLFVLDWFKKRHKKWIYATQYALKHGIKPSGEASSPAEDRHPLEADP